MTKYLDKVIIKFSIYIHSEKVLSLIKFPIAFDETNRKTFIFFFDETNRKVTRWMVALL